jgi:hypothetical protein
MEKLIVAAERYMEAVRSLGEDAGNKRTFFEAPLLTNPNGEEAIRRWRELNDAGVALSAAVAEAKGEH